MSMDRECPNCGAEYDCRHGSKCPACGHVEPVSKFKKDDVVYLKQQGRWFRYTFHSYVGWQEAVKLDNGLGPFTARESDLTSEADYNKLMEEQRKSELAREYSDLIERWGSGPPKPGLYQHTKYVKQIASEFDISARALGQQVACLKRWGLIK